jgi:hypothetical protein
MVSVSRGRGSVGRVSGPEVWGNVSGCWCPAEEAGELKVGASVDCLRRGEITGASPWKDGLEVREMYTGRDP